MFMQLLKKLRVGLFLLEYLRRTFYTEIKNLRYVSWELMFQLSVASFILGFFLMIYFY